MISNKLSDKLPYMNVFDSSHISCSMLIERHIDDTFMSFYKQEALTELATCPQNYARQNILIFLLLESGDTSTEIRL